MPVKGKFVTFEGTEGAGKSTQIPIIQGWLIENNINAIVTREPGGTELAEKIRHLLLTEDMSAEAELLLMFAARKEHIEQVILPTLKRGDWVLCDRFTESTYAYQAAGRAIDVEKIAYLENWLQGSLRPDRTFWFDIDVCVGIERAKKRHVLDRFEQEKIEFFENVRQGYQNLLMDRPDQFVRIDAFLSVEQISQQLKVELSQYL